MMSAIKARLERLESLVDTTKSKKRVHFTSGIADGLQGDIIRIMTDRHGQLLNGWHVIDDDMVLVVDIE